jgi:hypothetical protein
MTRQWMRSTSYAKMILCFFLVVGGLLIFTGGRVSADQSTSPPWNPSLGFADEHDYTNCSPTNVCPDPGEYGVDVALPAGTAVLAPQAGKVILYQPCSGYCWAPGRLIFQLDSGGLYSGVLGFGHVDNPVPVGTEVAAGAQIATVGDNGSNSHVEFMYAPAGCSDTSCYTRSAFTTYPLSDPRSPLSVLRAYWLHSGSGNDDESAPSTYVTPDGQQHIVYEDSSGNVWQKIYNNGWSSPMPIASGAASSPSTFLTPGQQHVAFVGTDNRIHHVYYANGQPNGQWNDGSPPNTGPAPATQSNVSTYVSLDGQQHIVYVGTDGYLYQYFYSNGWYQNNVGDHNSQPQAQGSPSTYVTSDGQQHVVYRGTNNNLYQWFYTTQWNANTVGGTGNVASSPSTYVTPDGQQHVAFRGNDNNLYQYFYSGGWNWNPISNGGPPAQGMPSTYVTSDGQQHVIYRGTDNNLHEYFYSGPWDPLNLQVVGQVTGSPSTYTTPGQQHVAYYGTNGSIHNQWWSPTSPWSHDI